MDYRPLILCLSVTWLAAAEGEPLPASVVRDLESARTALTEDNPETARRLLAEYAESNHPDVLALRAITYDRCGDYPAASTTYEAAIQAAPRQDLINALLHLHATAENWPDLLASAGRWLDRGEAPLPVLLLTATAAHRLSDIPLATDWAALAQRRFPSAEGPRRLLLDLALAQNDRNAARAQTEWLIQRQPDNADLWQTLAYLADDEEQQRQLLEVAVLAGAYTHVRQHWITSLLEAGQLQAARTAIVTLDRSDPAARDLALRVAVAAEDHQHARAILDQIPIDERTPAHLRVAARLALARGDKNTATQALEHLIELGVMDLAILLQAARLAEETERPDQAEGYYRQAAIDGDPTAKLYLARLLMKQQRYSEARTIIASVVNEHPDLTAARQMLAVLDQVGHP